MNVFKYLFGFNPCRNPPILNPLYQKCQTGFPKELSLELRAYLRARVIIKFLLFLISSKSAVIFVLVIFRIDCRCL